MSPLIEQHREELAELCRRYHVKRLELFGSAARGELRPESDLDFLVEFGEVPGERYFHAYFAFKESLEKLFARQVDLVEEGAIKNPYFLAGLNENRLVVYAG